MNGGVGQALALADSRSQMCAAFGTSRCGKGVACEGVLLTCDAIQHVQLHHRERRLQYVGVAWHLFRVRGPQLKYRMQ